MLIPDRQKLPDAMHETSESAAAEPPANPEDLHPYDRISIANAASRAFTSGVPQIVSYRRRGPDGEWRWAEYRADPGYPVRVEVEPMVQAPAEAWTTAGSLGDTEEAVSAAKIIEDLYGAAFAFDARGYFTYATPVAQTSISMTLEHLNARLSGDEFVDGGDLGWKLGVHPDDYEGAAAELRRCMQAAEPFNYEYRVLRSTGLYVWHRFSIRPTRDANGRVTGWYGTGSDIDVFKKTEEALRGSERSLRELVETAPALIWCMTPEGEPIYFSRQLRNFFGFDVQDRDVSGSSRLTSILGAVVHPEDLEKVNARDQHLLDTGEPYALMHRLRRFDGVYRWVETRIAAMRDESGALVQWNGVCLDIDEQVRAQEELRLAHGRLARASQAASLAELSASIAHEVNQPLAAIMTNSQACHRWLSSEPPNVARAQLIVERISRSAQLAADIVSRVRALFSQSVNERASTAVAELFEQARDLMADEASRRGASLHLSLESGLPTVSVDRVQVQQVLVNVIRNGLEAMEEISSQKMLQITVRRADNSVLAQIDDSGPGIEFPERIFEPFFSTKSEGMGMGLAICRSIIEAHGGRLWAEQNQGNGGRVLFTLPIA